MSVLEYCYVTDYQELYDMASERMLEVLDHGQTDILSKANLLNLFKLLDLEAEFEQRFEAANL